jgi:hypothetical protein
MTFLITVFNGIDRLTIVLDNTNIIPIVRNNPEIVVITRE